MMLQVTRVKENDALNVWYQPIFDLQGRTAIGVEALLRRDARVGPTVPWDLVVSPDLALLTETAVFVLETVLEDASEWRRWNSGAAPLQLHVNLSPLLVETDAYVGAAERLLDRHPLASWVVFEVTECLPLDPVLALPRMSRLHKQGVRFALDDFGAGFSNFYSLARLPFEVVKVDRSLVADVDKRHRVAALMRGLLDVAKALDMQVVAEGIETPAEQVALTLLGCSLGQGFLLGHPEPYLLGNGPAAPAEGAVAAGWQRPSPRFGIRSPVAAVAAA